jgi:hypothetical protein
VQGSGDVPTCDSIGKWQCPNNGAVTLIQQQFQEFESTKGVLDTYLGKYPPVFAVFCSANTTGFIFPCSDDDKGNPNVGMIQKDWLSGNVGVASGSGHLVGTFLSDTLQQPKLQALFSDSLGVGYFLITPLIILVGYQLLYASWVVRQMNILEILPRLLLSIVAIGLSYQIASMLINLTDTFNTAIVRLHATMPYPLVRVGSHGYAYTLDGDNDPTSFRGIVVPVSRWGCVLNDFMAILGMKFLSDLSGFIPFVGGFTKFALGIVDMIDVFKHVGEFMLLILSINLCTQAFVRIILINYYIVMAPIAFACWSLPAGVGQRGLSQWAKGFLSILFIQTAQLFVLTTLPLLTPEFPDLPLDRFGAINMIFKQLPRVIALMAVVQVPKFMGTGVTRAIAQAGTVASGAVAAAGAVAYNTV